MITIIIAIVFLITSIISQLYGWNIIKCSNETKQTLMCWIFLVLSGILLTLILTIK